MNVDRATFMLSALTVLAAVAAHEIGAEAYPQFAVAVAAWSWIVWRAWRGRPVIASERTVQIVSFIAFAFFMFRGIAMRRFGGAPFDVRVAEVGHFLVVYLLLALSRRKTAEQYGWLHFASLILMGTAGLIMPGFGYGVLFVAYLFAATCSMQAFNLWRAAVADGSLEETRIGRNIFLRSAQLCLLGVLPLALIFAALPRRQEYQQLTPSLVSLTVQPVTGFGEDVEMGAVGELQESPELVMHLNAFDAETNQPIDAHNLLLRGVALDTYVLEDGLWRWRASGSLDRPMAFLTDADVASTASAAAAFPQMDMPGFRRVRLETRLEPISSQVIFMPFMPESVELPNRRIILVNDRLQAISVRRERARLEYTAVSRIHPLSPPPPGISEVPADESLLAETRALPEGLAPRVVELARSIAPDGDYPDDYSKAMRLVQYLSGPPFTYTMRLDPTPGVEPVEDFLFNRRTGHCEYFAAALAVMLRSVGIPARMVNGFKVTEMNQVGGYFVVRQADAHSWVEAYIRPVGWRTLDASAARPAEPGKPFLSRIFLGDVIDTLDFAWGKYVVGYSRDQQISLRDNAAGKSRAVMNRLGTAADWLSRKLPGMPSAPSALQKILSMAIFIMAAIAAGFIARTLLRLLRIRRGARAARPAIHFYRKMEKLLARYGLRRQAGQTPWEFCDSLPTAGWPAVEPARVIVSGFYDARYGRRELSAKELRRIEKALGEMRAARRKSPYYS